MPLVDHLTNNMTSGELTPFLKSRGDLDLSRNGLETLKNARVLPYGGVQRRMGFEFIAEGKYDTSAVRLIPFQYSEEQAYVLEFGHKYVRFYTAGSRLSIESTGCAAEGYVYGKEYPIGEIVKYNCQLYVAIKPSDDKIPTDTAYWEVETSYNLAYEIASPYSAGDLFSLRFTQSADVLYIAHKDYQVRKLLRYGVTDWEIEEILFTGGPFLLDNIDPIYLSPGGLDIGQSISITSSKELFTSGHLGCLWKLTNGRSAKSVSKTLDTIGIGSASDAIAQGTGNVEVVIMTADDEWQGTVVIQKSHDAGVSWNDYTLYHSAGVDFLYDEDTETTYRAYLSKLDQGQVDVQINQLAVNGEPGIVRVTEVVSGLEIKAEVLKSIQSVNLAVEDDVTNMLTNGYFFDGGNNWTVYNPGVGYDDPSVSFSDNNCYISQIIIGFPLRGSAGGIYNQVTGATAADNHVIRVETGYIDSYNAGYIRVSIGTAAWGTDILNWQNVSGDSSKSFVFTPQGTSFFINIQGYSRRQNIKSVVVQNLENSVHNSTFVWAEGAWSGERGYPRAITFHEQRLMLAGTDYSPLTIWGSETGNFENFLAGANDADSIEYELNANDVNLPRWLTSWIDLHAGTQGGEWRITGGGQSLSPSNVKAIKPTTYGSSDVQALQIGMSILFVDRNETSLRQLTYNNDTNAYSAPNLAKFAEHITKAGIRDIAYQQKPEPMIWCILNNGKIGCVSYMPSQNVLGWSEYDTQGEFQSIAIIPSLIGGEDEVWASVARVINNSTVYYIERKRLDTWEYEEILSVEDPYVEGEEVYFDSFPQTITLICETANAKIWYTIDGTEPVYKINGAEYIGSFSIAEPATIKARAYIVTNNS